MFVRTNSGYREFGSVPGYEHQVGIAVPLREAESTGLIRALQKDALLGEIEEMICNSLEEQEEVPICGCHYYERDEGVYLLYA